MFFPVLLNLEVLIDISAQAQCTSIYHLRGQGSSIQGGQKLKDELERSAEAVMKEKVIHRPALACKTGRFMHVCDLDVSCHSWKTFRMHRYHHSDEISGKTPVN